MTLPTLIPSARAYKPGNWPVRTYNAQNGTEVRLLYGSQRFNLAVTLTYANIPDATAEDFLDDYISKNGTYEAFELTVAEASAIAGGWAGAPASLRAPAGVEWRYDSAPTIESIVPGISTVTISLRGVI